MPFEKSRSQIIKQVGYDLRKSSRKNRIINDKRSQKTESDELYGVAREEVKGGGDWQRRGGRVHETVKERRPTLEGIRGTNKHEKKQ